MDKGVYYIVNSKCHEEIVCHCSTIADRQLLTQCTVAAHTHETLAACGDLSGGLLVLHSGDDLVKSDITHLQPAAAVSLHDVRDRVKHHATHHSGHIGSAEVVT